MKKLKIKKVCITCLAAVAAAVMLTSCGTAANTGGSEASVSQTDAKPENSGPITYAMEDASPAIQNAPAYDTADAKKYIDSMPEIRELVDSIEEAPDGITAFGEKTPSDDAL